MSISSVLHTGLTGLANAEQMVNRASNNLADPLASGLARETAPSQGAGATVDTGAVEAPIADIGESLVDLILASTQFRANVNVLEVADELSASLAGIKRNQ
jgi:flagellar hook protein FlgE